MFQLLRKQDQSSNSKLKKPSIVEASRFKSAIKEWRYPVKWNLEETKLKDIPLCISVGGGKGGVGKTLVSSNLSYSLAQSGYKVLVVDLDLGCSNLHSHFSIRPTKLTLSQYLKSETLEFSKIIANSSLSNWQIIPGGGDERYV